MTIALEDVLHEKALDQIAHLQASFDAGRISAETFKVAIETIWNVLGGCIRSEDFRDLMQAANKETKGLQPEPRIRVLSNGARQLLLMRRGEEVRVVSSRDAQTRTRSFEMDDDAISYVSQLEAAATKQGFGEYPSE